MDKMAESSEQHEAVGTLEQQDTAGKLHKDDTIVEEIKESIFTHWGDSSTSEDDDDEKPPVVVAQKKRLFGRKETLHTVLGGGKVADVILWRNKKMSVGILAGVTTLWLLFEFMGYHLLALFSKVLIFALCVLFIWSNIATLLKKSPPKIPEIVLSEDVFLDIARLLSYEFNEVFATFKYVAQGKDWKKFIMATAVLYVISIIGSWFDFLTLFYIVFVILYFIPVIYEKYEDHVDGVAERALVHINKHCAVLDAKVFKKIPKLPFFSKKRI